MISENRETFSMARRNEYSCSTEAGQTQRQEVIRKEIERLEQENTYWQHQYQQIKVELELVFLLALVYIAALFNLIENDEGTNVSKTYRKTI